MEKGDLITYRGVEYVVTSLENGVHAVLASTDDEAGTSGSPRYLGSIDEVEAELAEQAETAEDLAAKVVALYDLACIAGES